MLVILICICVVCINVANVCRYFLIQIFVKKSCNVLKAHKILTYFCLKIVYQKS